MIMRPPSGPIAPQPGMVRFRASFTPILKACLGCAILVAAGRSNSALAWHAPAQVRAAGDEASVSQQAEALAAAAEAAAQRLDLADVLDASLRWELLLDGDGARSQRVWGALAGAAFASGDFKLAEMAATKWDMANRLTKAGGGDATNMLSIARVLADAPAQRIESYAPRRISIAKDVVGLSRAAIAVNDTPIDAVLDTGANLSTVSASMAHRLGLHMLSGDATVGSATRDTVETRLAVADRLELAGITLRNVVFLVLPDVHLKLPIPDYSLDIIVGFPVFRALERINFDHGGGFTPARSRNDGAPPNIHFKGSSIYVDTLVASKPVAMHLDTGARATSLPGSFAMANPELVEGLVPITIAFGGAGGSTKQQAVELRDIAVEIDGQLVRLDSVTVALGNDDAGAVSRVPILGQDILSRFDAYAIDIPARRLVVTKPRS